MKKLTFLLALLLASGTMIGCEKDIPSEETTKTDYSKPPLETKAPEAPGRPARDRPLTA